MNLTTLKKLALTGESETLEFKKSTADLAGACESLCGMLNAGLRARVVIGVFGGKLVGQEVTDRTQQEISQYLRSFTPDPQIKLSMVAVEGSRHIIVLESLGKPGQIPYFFRGKAYQRIGTTTTLLTRDHLQTLFIKQHRQTHPYDASEAKKYALDDLDLERMQRAVELGILANRLPASARSSIKNMLFKLGLVIDNRLTHAAVILFGKSSAQLPIQCTMMMARFRGTDKGAFLDHKQIIGNSFDMLDEGMMFLSRHLPLRGTFEKDRLQRIDEPIIPTEVLREALVNAICHRDYEHHASSIHLAIYDDRVEIVNSGGLMPGIHLSDLKGPHKSVPRNPLIAQVFYHVGYVERWGQGTLKMINLCKNRGLSEPKFIEHPSWFGVSFAAPIQQPQPTSNALPRREQILRALSTSNKLTINELCNIFPSLSRRTIQRELQTLKDENKVDVSGQGTSSTIWSLSKNH